MRKVTDLLVNECSRISLAAFFPEDTNDEAKMRAVDGRLA